MDRGSCGGEGSARDPTPWIVAQGPPPPTPGTCGAMPALRACQLLMLNAWRMRREETRVLRARVDQMRLQVRVPATSFAFSHFAAPRYAR